jgi:hypothetical protein
VALLALLFHGPGPVVVIAISPELRKTSFKVSFLIVCELLLRSGTVTRRGGNKFSKLRRRWRPIDHRGDGGHFGSSGLSLKRKQRAPAFDVMTGGILVVTSSLVDEVI